MAQPWADAPLTQTPDNSTLLVSIDGRQFAYRAQGEQPRSLPRDFIPQALLQRSSGGNLVIGRWALRDGIAAAVEQGGGYRALGIDESLAAKLYFLHAFNIGKNAYLVVYDVDETMPSGRSGRVVREGVDIYRAMPAGDTLRLEKVADKLTLSGMDARFQDLALPDGHLLCAQSACVRLTEDASGQIAFTEIKGEGWTGRVLIEAVAVGRAARGLFRLDYDDRFRSPPAAGEVIYQDCAIWPLGDCRDVSADWLPKGYAPTGQPLALETCAEIAPLLRRDIARMPGHGLTYLGMNNHEGRLPWGQVYVLDGMLDVIERLALPQPRFDLLREDMRRRVVLELGWWSRLAETDKPWFWSRRYSLERVDILSMVHLGRMARVVGRAMRMGLLADDHLAANLREEMTNFDRSVERLDGVQLFIKRGAPFWLDGANTPWNYQSGWIEGLAELHSLRPISSNLQDTVRRMTASFLAAEVSENRPRVWQYCAGPCQEGWSAASGTSVNTPTWEGNKTRTSTAHISYRTMDVRAVLDTMRTFRDAAPIWFPAYVSELVSQGWIYPMAAAPLRQFGLSPALSPTLVAAYGRAATPAENHNQIWAIDAVAKRLDCQ
ncbi:hypothetical protein [Bosea thiooxidans]|uniref:hypothetical protein n=1 Tax=Bosea thiooxidans TaxID=53254 RepID=UPI0011169FCB|nr:hypothetical protein [Bosea thiooxidans]